MDLVNNRAKYFLFIFRNIEFPNHYLLLYDTESTARFVFESTTRTGPKYGVMPEDGIPYGYNYVPMERVLQYETDEHFVHFIKLHIAEYASDFKKNYGEWGWYIINEINVEEWERMYQAQIAEQRKQALEAANKNKKPEQISLF